MKRLGVVEGSQVASDIVAGTMEFVIKMPPLGWFLFWFLPKCAWYAVGGKHVYIIDDD